jgi:AraC-like DNA-binding protein
MKFDIYFPSEILKPYVKMFAVQESSAAGLYKVLPDTGLVIGFQFRGRLAYLDDTKEISLATSGVTGLHNQYRIFKNSPGIGTVLVFFNEGGAVPFFAQPIHELFQQSISLDNFMLRSELLLLEERLYEADWDEGKVAVVENFLISRMKPNEPDKIIHAALAIIHKRRGDIRIKDLAEQLHISQSPLEKRFRSAIGTSPKKFASIVRLKNLIAQYDPTRNLGELGYEAGFYDQAHFIKEFRTFTGEAPENYFSDLK